MWHPDADSRYFYSVSTYERSIIGYLSLYGMYLIYLFRFHNKTYLTLWNKFCFSFLFCTSFIMMMGRMSYLQSQSELFQLGRSAKIHNNWHEVRCIYLHRTQASNLVQNYAVLCWQTLFIMTSRVAKECTLANRLVPFGLVMVMLFICMSDYVRLVVANFKRTGDKIPYNILAPEYDNALVCDMESKDQSTYKAGRFHLQVCLMATTVWMYRVFSQIQPTGDETKPRITTY
jgi:hypothetical protein